MLFIVCSTHTVSAQRCATYTNFINDYTTDAAYAHRYDSLQVLINNYVAKHPNPTRGGIDTIPIVVHVVYNLSTENISAQQVQSQIDVLNTDYARLNADSSNTPYLFKSVASATNFRFALARRDPNGIPTTGITRTYTGHTVFTNSNAVKYTTQGGQDVWDRDNYLNIWVCALTGGILGYTQYPGGNAATDGCVIDYRAFGTLGTALSPYNQGRTGTHEVGHWFNLIHVWGDDYGACSGSDSIADTPNQADCHYSCPTFPSPSCSNTSDMYMNYMDYTPDSCMNLFTKGQFTRMTAALNIARSSILKSTTYRPVYTRDIGIVEAIEPTGVYCDSLIKATLTLFNFGKDSLHRFAIQYTYDNNIPQTYWWYGVLLPGDYVTLSLPAMSVPIGPHTFKCYLASILNNDNYRNNDSTTTAFSINRATSTLQLPLDETFESGVFPKSNWQVYNPDNDVTWSINNGVSAYSNGSYSVYMDNYSQVQDITGTVDAFITPVYDLSKVSNPQLNFDVAYSGYYNSSLGDYKYDALKVYYSTDCGQTWTTVYNKTSSALQTAPAQYAQFVPTASQWRTEQVSIASAAAQNAIELKFENTSGWGNDLFIDNIKFTDASAGITPVQHNATGFRIYPNPAYNVLTIENNYAPNDDIHVTLYDILGQPVYTSTLSGKTNNIYLQDIAAGMYIITLTDAANTYTQKVVVKH